MTLYELIARVRARLDDFGGDTGDIPTGFTSFWEADDSGCSWKNEELVSYAKAACMELAHRIPIRDSTDSEVTRIYLYPGVAQYDVDPRVLAIDSVVLESTNTPLVKIANAQERDRWVDPRDTTYADPQVVQQYREDLDAPTLTVYATPTVADTLLLAVRRLPLTTLTWARRMQDNIEFAPHLQEALINWMCMQAYLKHDADTHDRELAGYFQGQFTDQVGPRVNFKHAQILKDVAGTRLRTRTQY